MTAFLHDQLRHVRPPRRPTAPVALVLDARLPTPGHDAGSGAIVSHMRSLQRLGYHVVFVPLDQPHQSGNTVPGVPGAECATAPAFASVEDALRQHSDAALVYAHRAASMTLYGPLARHCCPAARLLYAVADLHFLRLGRQAAIECRPQRLHESQRLRDQELAAVRLADITITHSTHEAALLRELVPGASIRTVPWDIATTPGQRPFADRSGVVFVGGMEQAPNLDAVRLLARDVMPRVARLDPSIVCSVAGAGLQAQDRLDWPRNMRALGHVPSLPLLLGRSRLAVAPLRFGAGVKGKVIESFAAGLPCVMTPIAAEGLPLDGALAELIHDDPDSLAHAIVALHTDPAANRRAAETGLAFAANHLSPESLDAALGAAAASAVSPHPPRRPRINAFGSP